MYSREYTAYARAHGRSPEGQLNSDHYNWPGGIMAGFTQWMAERKSAFHQVSPQSFCNGKANEGITDSEKWIAFLENRKITKSSYAKM